MALLRLVLFGTALLSGYYGLTAHWGFGLLSVAGFALFLLAVARTSDLRYRHNKVRELIELNRRERKALKLDFADFADGDAYRSPGHYFSEDLDLFGPGSFFQYLNRCGLPEGEAQLAAWLASNSHPDMVQRQQAVRELAVQPDWRQDFYATARLARTEIPLQAVLGWLEAYSPHMPTKISWLSPLFGLSALGAWTGYFLGHWSIWIPVLLFLAGLGIAGAYLRRTQELSEKSGRVRQTFVQYQRLVGMIEAQDFRARSLLQYKDGLQVGGRPLSAILKAFAGKLEMLEHRSNLLIGLLGNGIFLWDLWAGWRTERWIADYGSRVREWFDVIASVDASISLGNFAFNHPGFAYPEILDSGPSVLEVEGLAHPLLPAEKRVPNDYAIREGSFHIITGANMAGKSTFLRSLTLAMVMARCGLPVCAAAMHYRPLPLITSMRTADSLARNESYFFAELKRLKQLVDALSKRPHFVLLDEILKGTNSKDKARGSRLFLERLVSSGATGLIATHDLSLCEAADSLEQVDNYYFDAEIRDGELFFDYKLRPGICSNMNASFLLRKMGIVEE